MTPSPTGDVGRTKRTVRSLARMKEQGRRIVCLTAYDALTAGLLDEVGVDVILVGDSGGQVMAGRPNTLGTTLEEMLHFTRWAARGVEHALLVADMPFLTYQVNPDEAVRNAGRLMAEGGAEAVKLEGGRPMTGTVRRLVQTGIPVMGHLGLTPQSVNVFGGYKLQAADERTAGALLEDARALEESGCFALVLEKVPAPVAARVTDALSIPTIGIGAGPDCDGQVLVTQDMLGIFEDFKPRFVRRYAELAETIRDAVRAYAEDVRQGSFPSDEESYEAPSSD